MTLNWKNTILVSSKLDKIIEMEEPGEPPTRLRSALYWVQDKVEDVRDRRTQIPLTLRYRPGQVLVGYIPITAEQLRSYMTVKMFGRPVKVMRDTPITDAVLHRDDWNAAPLLVHFRSWADKEKTVVYYYHLAEELEVAIYAKLRPEKEK